MVKSTPKNLKKSSRKRKLFDYLYRNKHRDINANVSSTTPPPNTNINTTIASLISDLFHAQKYPTNFKFKAQETKQVVASEVTVTPPTRKKRRSSRSPPNSFSFSASSTYGTCTSSSTSSGCFLDSKSSPSTPFLGSKSSPSTPFLGSKSHQPYYLLHCHCTTQQQQQQLQQSQQQLQHSQQQLQQAQQQHLLRRTVSDPPKFVSDFEDTS